MWSSEIKPSCFLHVSSSRNITVYHVVDIFLSSSVVERHVFSNGRKCSSFLNHLCRVMPYHNSYSFALSFEKYTIFAEELTDEFIFND